MLSEISGSEKYFTFTLPRALVSSHARTLNVWICTQIANRIQTLPDIPPFRSLVVDLITQNYAEKCKMEYNRKTKGIKQITYS